MVLTQEHQKLLLEQFVQHKKRRRKMSVRQNHLSLWLGRLIIAHNNLESEVALTIEGVLKEILSDDREKANRTNFFLAEMFRATFSCQQSVKFLAALLFQLHKNDEKQKERINLILGLILNAETFRNTMVHSQWEMNWRMSDIERRKFSIKQKSGLKLASGSPDIKQLQQAVKAMDILTQSGLMSVYWNGNFKPNHFNANGVGKMRKAFALDGEPQAPVLEFSMAVLL